MSRSIRPFQPPAECPVCGAEVPPRSRSCPDCGADEKTGWNEDATHYDGLDLPDSAFEDEATDCSKQPQRTLTSTGIPVATWIVAVALLIAIVLVIFFTV